MELLVIGMAGLILGLSAPALAGANGQILSPLSGSTINYCPVMIVARAQHPSGVNNVRFFAYYDGGYHYANADYTGTDVGGGWFEFTGSWDCGEVIANPQTIKVRIDVYPNAGGPLPEEDEQSNITLSRTPAGTIISPTNPPTTEISNCPQLVQAAVNHPNGADYVTFYVWYDSYWHYIGRDYSEPFSASWDCGEVSDQSGVKFRIDVYATGIGLAQEVDIQSGFSLNKTRTGTITSPTNPPTTEITDCPQLVEAAVNHPNGADYITFYVWYDSYWHYIGRDYAAPFSASWDCNEASNQAGVKFRIDVYVTGIGLTQEADIQGDFILNKNKTGTITSPTNPPTTEITYCPQQVQSEVNHPNGADYVTFYVWYDTSWHYIGRDYSAPFSASWDCGEASNQAGVKFRIDVYVTGIGLTQEADIQGDFNLNKTGAGTITSPTNPPTTDITNCPLQVEAAVNHPNGADYVTFFAWYDSGWNYIGRDYSAPFSASWDCWGITNQSGVKFRIDVYVTGIGLSQEADVEGDFILDSYRMRKICSSDGTCWGDTDIVAAGTRQHLLVEVYGFDGKGVQGKTVTFAIVSDPGGAPAPSLTPSNGQAVTDSGGRATVDLNTSPVPGQYKVSVSGYGSPLEFTINSAPSDHLNDPGGVFDNSGPFNGVGGVTQNVFTPASGEEAVLNPAWNSQGTQIAAVMIAPASGSCAADGNTSWNIYVYTISNGTCVRVTNDDMRVAPASKPTFSPDGAWVLFAAKEMEATCAYAGNKWCTVQNQELWKVHSDGSDKDKTQIQLVDAGWQITKNWNFNWNDPDWKSCGCAASLGGNIVKFRYNDLSSDVTNALTNLFSGEIEMAFRPMLNSDCSKIVFAAFNYSQYGSWTFTPVDIYILNNVEGARVNPVTSLVSPLITPVTNDSVSTGAYYFPSWTTDEQSVIYSHDLSKKFHICDFYKADVVDTLFNGRQFRNYLDYVADPSLNIPVLPIGDNEWNEWGMVQCGPNCPDGRPFAFISQTASDQGALKLLTLKDKSTIIYSGGVLFNKGLITAIFPPSSIQTDQTVVQSETPQTTPTGDGDTTKLVFAGIAREFFPDGAKFNKNIRLIFYYCDKDNGVGDGYLDVIQDDACSGGTSPQNTNVKETELYVYYWNDIKGVWERYGGYVNAVNNYIIVETNHFSTYGVFGGRNGFSVPAAFTPLTVTNLHAYPNPWRSGDPTHVTFNADAVTSNGLLTADIWIVDISGREIYRGVSAGIDPTSLGAADVNGGVKLIEWNVLNNSGSRVGSGVYLYRLRISDGISALEQTGKIAVVK